MTIVELDEVAEALGGKDELIRILHELSDMSTSNFTSPLREKITDCDSLYHYFRYHDHRPTAGYYIEITEPDERFAGYTVITLQYGFYAGCSAGEGFYFSTLKTSDGKFKVIQEKQLGYPTYIH